MQSSSSEYSPLKRKFTQLTLSEHNLSSDLYQSKRYKFPNSHFGENDSINFQKYEPGQIIKIPTRSEIIETSKREQYLHQMKAMLKKEKSSYLNQMKSYDFSGCGPFYGENYDCSAEIGKISPSKKSTYLDKKD